MVGPSDPFANTRTHGGILPSAENRFDVVVGRRSLKGSKHPTQSIADCQLPISSWANRQSKIKNHFLAQAPTKGGITITLSVATASCRMLSARVSICT